MWGGHVVVIATHNGADNTFNELVQDVIAGRLPYSRRRITLDDALADGLYHCICRVTTTATHPYHLKLAPGKSASVPLSSSSCRNGILLPSGPDSAGGSVFSVQFFLDVIVKNGDDDVMRYDGGKGACFAHIINLMPPHERYIESHLGGGAVMRNKRPAKEQLGIDIDPSVIAIWTQFKNINCKFINGDAVKILEKIIISRNTLIYADPPYYPETRRRKRVYRFDYTDDDHMKLIECLIKKHCMVMISGYFSHLYESEFKNWNSYKFKNKTHIGVVDEYVWFNFDKPKVLHDIRFLGENFREREIIKRRSDRLKSRLSRLSAVEQSAILEWLSKEVNARVS